MSKAMEKYYKQQADMYFEYRMILGGVEGVLNGTIKASRSKEEVKFAKRLLNQINKEIAEVERVYDKK